MIIIKIKHSRISGNYKYMKSSIISFILIITTILAYSQSGQDYMLIMVKQKKEFRASQTEQDFQELANNFESIANANTDKWHPLYYAAFCYINMSFTTNSPEIKDSYLDDAQTFIDKALEIYPEESELFVLQGLLYQGRIQIDPAKRGRSFAGKAQKALKKAKELNPENPRAYYLLGMNALHTPKSVGGGPKSACPLFKTAIAKFEKNIPEHVLSPTWGGERNQKLYSENCLK